METFIVEVSRGENTGTAAVMAVSPEGALASIALLYENCSVGVPVQMGDHQACQSCPARERCEASIWEGVSRIGDERQDLKHLSVVHTCKSCFEKVVTFDLSTSSMVVPDTCPRWSPNFASAWDCGTCSAARKAIGDAHPAKAARLEAAGMTMKAILSSVAKGGEGESTHDAAVAMVTALSPFRHVQPTEAEFTQAMSLVDALTKVALREPAFVDEVAQNTTWDVTYQNIEWAEAIILILRRHPSDVDAVVREWTLVFDDRPPWCRAWVRVTIERRRAILRGWAAAVRESLKSPLPE